MTYKDFISKNKNERDKMIDALYEVGDNAFFFNLVYSHLHNEHKEYHPKFYNKALLIKVSNMTPEEKYEILKHIGDVKFSQEEIDKAFT